MEFEAVVAGSGLALGARERVLLARLGIEENREVAADSDVAGVAQRIGVAPTTTQSRSPTGSLSNASRTAPPTR
jgi:hypothetical protein